MLGRGGFRPRTVFIHPQPKPALLMYHPYSVVGLRRCKSGGFWGALDSDVFVRAGSDHVRFLSTHILNPPFDIAPLPIPVDPRGRVTEYVNPPRSLAPKNQTFFHTLGDSFPLTTICGGSYNRRVVREKRTYQSY